MQIGKSFGEICRYCGSNMDVFEPSHFAGTCAPHTPDAKRTRPWADRLAAAATRHVRRALSDLQKRVGVEGTSAVTQDPGRSRPLFGRLPPRQNAATATSAEDTWRIRPAGPQ